MRTITDVESSKRPKLLRWGLVVAASSVVVACSSGKKQADNDLPPPPSAADKSEVASPVAETEPSKAETVPMKETPGVPVEPIGRGPLDAKYKALAQAVKSQSASQISNEASKILIVNANDLVALNTLALMQLKRGKPGAAKILINRAMEKNPPSAALYNNLAVVLLEESDQIGAILNLKKALQLDRGHPEASANLGAIYARGGDYGKAKVLLEQAYRANRANAAVANNYAIALRATKDYESAKKVYEDLVRSSSNDVNVLLNYAILLIDFMGKPKEGLDVVNKIRFIETDRKDVLARANALEKKARSEVK